MAVAPPLPPAAFLLSGRKWHSTVSESGLERSRNAREREKEREGDVNALESGQVKLTSMTRPTDATAGLHNANTSTHGTHLASTYSIWHIFHKENTLLAVYLAKGSFA